MKRFELTADHVKLLRRANVSWMRAPAIDPKRPFGNGDYLGDMAEILGIEWKRDEGDNYMPKALCGRLEHLYEELEDALQIVLVTGTFEPGAYTADDYSNNWTTKTEGTKP